MKEFFAEILPYIPVAAMIPIINTLIKEWAQTARLRMEISSRSTSAASDKTQAKNKNIPAAKSSTIGLSAILLATLSLAFMAFGPQSAAALSTGDAASIAQSLCLFASGLWLFSRG